MRSKWSKLLQVVLNNKIKTMNDTYEFEIHYDNLEEPLYLTNDKNYICDDMRDFMEELGIIMEEVIYKVQAV